MAQLMVPTLESADLNSVPGPQGRRRELISWSYSLASTRTLCIPHSYVHTPHRALPAGRQWGWKGEVTRVGRKLLGLVDVVILVLVLVSRVCS